VGHGDVIAAMETSNALVLSTSEGTLDELVVVVVVVVVGA